MRDGIGGGRMTRGGTNPRRANGTQRNHARAAVRQRGEPCWICGLPVDHSLPRMDPCEFVVDELEPVSRGGSPYRAGNLATAHRCCNGWRSARSVEYVERVRAEVLAAFGGWSCPQDFVAKAKAVERARRSGGAPVSLAPPRTTTDW